jgi:hypothetical protein
MNCGVVSSQSVMRERERERVNQPLLALSSYIYKCEGTLVFLAYVRT